MKSTFVVILFFLMGISGCAISSDTTNYSTNSKLVSTSSAFPKNYEANFIDWHDDDLLVYHARDGLYSYQPSNGITKKLLSEELTGNNWLNIDWNSKYFGSSPDKSKYLISTGKRKMLQVYAANTDKQILSLDYPNDEIYEAGWFDNENVFIATRFTLYKVNIISREQVQITEDSSNLISRAGKSIGDYIWWVTNVNKIGEKLYYNGVRSLTNQISSTIYCNDKLSERKLLERAILLKTIDNQRFVYLKQSNDGYEGTYIYDLEMGVSSLVSKEDLLNTGGIFITSDRKLAFVTIDGVPHIFDPVTKRSQEFSKLNYFNRLMGSYKINGAYVFLFGGYQSGSTMTFSYNTKTDRQAEVAGYEGEKGTNMRISPSGKYIVVNQYNFFDLISSDNL